LVWDTINDVRVTKLKIMEQVILTYSESTQEFLEFLQLEKDYRTEALDLLEEGKSRYLADLKINFKNSFESEFLSKKEITLLGVALAVNGGNVILRGFFIRKAEAEGATVEEVAEDVACSSLLSANSVFYRFRYFLK